MRSAFTCSLLTQLVSPSRSANSVIVVGRSYPEPTPALTFGQRLADALRYFVLTPRGAWIANRGAGLYRRAWLCVCREAGNELRCPDGRYSYSQGGIIVGVLSVRS